MDIHLIKYRKSANKIQQSPMIKVLEKIGIHETKLNIIKSIYRKPQPQHNTQSTFTRIINTRTVTLSSLHFYNSFSFKIYTSYNHR